MENRQNNKKKIEGAARDGVMYSISTKINRSGKMVRQMRGFGLLEPLNF